MGTPLVPPDVLEVWLRRLPPQVQESPAGLLLAAMVAEPVSPETAERLLERAFAAAPDVAAVRFACLNALVEVAFRRGDRRQMRRFVERLTGAAGADSERTAGWIALFRGLLAHSPDEVRAELAAPSLVSGSRLSPVQDWLRTHMLLLRLGDPVAAEPIARRAMSHAAPNLSVLFRCQLIESLRLRGRLDESEQLLPELLAGIHPAKVLTSPELVTCAVVLLSLLGRNDEAEALLRAHRPSIAGSSVAWAPVAGAIADAFLQVSRGDEQEAVATLRSVLHLDAVRSRAAAQVSAAALPLLYVLVPETRAEWDAQCPPGCFVQELELARAIVAIRDDGSLDAVTRLPPDARAILPAVLPAPWTAELALGMLATGQQEGRGLLDRLGPRARAVVRRQSVAAPAPIRATARGLLRDIPAAPAHRLELRVLGPMELRRDGLVVTARELRRERVRQLLGYLLTHDRPTRAAVMADLWPDLDEAAAGRNLRVTLSYLHSLLEPERDQLDPPYFVRSTGAVLQLVVDDALEVDVLRFEQYAGRGGPARAPGCSVGCADRLPAGSRPVGHRLPPGRHWWRLAAVGTGAPARPVRGGRRARRRAAPRARGRHRGPGPWRSGPCGWTAGRRAPTSSSSPRCSRRGTWSRPDGGCGAVTRCWPSSASRRSRGPSPSPGDWRLGFGSRVPADGPLAPPSDPSSDGETAVREEGEDMDSAEVTDVVRRAAEGEQAAWNAIVDEYGGVVQAVARGLPAERGADRGRRPDDLAEAGRAPVRDPRAGSAGRLAGDDHPAGVPRATPQGRPRAADGLVREPSRGRPRTVARPPTRPARRSSPCGRTTGSWSAGPWPRSPSSTGC